MAKLLPGQGRIVGLLRELAGPHLLEIALESRGRPASAPGPGPFRPVPPGRGRANNECRSGWPASASLRPGSAGGEARRGNARPPLAVRPASRAARPSARRLRTNCPKASPSPPSQGWNLPAGNNRQGLGMPAGLVQQGRQFHAQIVALGDQVRDASATAAAASSARRPSASKAGRARAAAGHWPARPERPVRRPRGPFSGFFDTLK